jgi:2-(1,2-epoxy-1,2-dihydrophenyl)acetyl-CoA isomerase
MEDPGTPFLGATDRGPVRWLTLQNPDRRNAIPIHGFDLLAEAFRDFEASDMRVLVVTGAGGHFCAGADLSAAEMPGDSAAENLKTMWRAAAAASALHRLTKPTIAAVDGVAVGAGMNLALGCDVVIASEAARFAELFVRRGLTLDFGGTWLLPRLVGLARARELALTGREVDAAEALGIGLVARVVPIAALEAEAAATAEALASGAPLAQGFIKEALDRSSSMTFEQAIRFEDQAQAVLLATEDFREAVAAFGAKRRPDFRGR